ncbi:SusC/RagA family TonB-linked outer membrane protein [Bacteroides thetaiotaomicron]|nr:SusC/RagA family TonB-linked outer membrane protein [Bacteroides thetaiotaomicron]MCS2998773.1 SusC/RagA family TonB-linked outer membrane protein [Bacteroides thetaiotaomicron]
MLMEFFKFQYRKADVLCLSHPGLLYKEIKVNKLKHSERIFKVTLAEAFIKNQATINGPYESKEKISFLGAASTVYTDQLTSMMGTTILPSLTGRLSGLNVSQYRGARAHQITANSRGDLIGNVPLFGEGFYSDNTEFSVSSRGNAPIVVVDGVQRELYSIDPDAIESVSIQKDALSSMFLGMQSSRGALMITTKEPIKEGFQLSFTGRFGVQSALKIPKPLSGYQYAYLLNEALQNDGKEPFYSYDDFNKFRMQSSPFTHPDVNWYDELLNNSSTTQSYNLNVTGGNKYAQYFISLGYMGENGLFINPSDNGDSHDTNLSLERYMISSKININITDDFTAKVTLLGRVEEGTQPGVGYGNLLNSIYNTPNNAYPIRNPNGTWGGNVSFDHNLMSQTINSGYITDGARDMLGSINLKYDFDKLVKGLSARMVGSVSIQNRSYIQRSKRSPVYSYTIDKEGNDVYALYGATQTQSNSFGSVTSYQQMYGQFAIDYDRRFGDHGIRASVMGDTRNVLVNYDLPQLPSNIIADVSYDYANKYFAQIAMSESYYNRYAPDRRWGTFYAFGLGWDMNKESFMENVDWMNLFKIRGTFGKTGNGLDNTGYYTYQQTFSSNVATGYPLGTNLGAGNITTENSPLANPFLTWEKAYKLNLGIDLALFNNRLKLTADYYNDKYFDLLQSRGKSIEIIGQNYPTENIGKVRRFGGELSLTYQDRIKDFNYYVSANWSSEQSKLLYMDEQKVPEEYLRQTGRPVGAIYGLVAEGFFTSREEIENSPVIDGFNNIQPGDIKYKDMNGDKVINEFDRTVIGGDKPYSYFGIDLGFEWKGLEFSMFWQGAYNRELMLNDWTLLEGFQSSNQQYGQAYENMLDRWTPETAETATLPRLTAGGSKYNQGNGWNSSFWLRSGNFIRLKNISLGYNLPDSFCRNYLGGTRVKIFVNGQNLLTKSACDLVDPEVGFTSYPIQRCISTGINVRF